MASHSTKKLVFSLTVLLVQRVQHGVTGAVGSCTCALHGLFAVIGGVPAKRPLVNGAVWVAVKGHAHVFQLIHHLGCFAAHVLDGVLVAEPIRPFDGVVKVIVPIVFGHIAQRRTNATLGRHGVRAGGENFGQHGHIQTGTRQLQRGTHA